MTITLKTKTIRFTAAQVKLAKRIHKLHDEGFEYLEIDQLLGLPCSKERHPQSSYMIANSLLGKATR